MQLCCHGHRAHKTCVRMAAPAAQELRNGRAAMIAIALILLLEGGSGTAFFI